MWKMSEKEAIEALKLQGGLEITGKAVRVAKFFEGLVIAEEALEEIQQQRATGMTPEQIKEMQMDYCAKGAVLEEYQAIGTPEQCREAVERMKPKKIIKWANGEEHCPNCDCDNSAIGYGVCIDCGQVLDWSE